MDGRDNVSEVVGVGGMGRGGGRGGGKEKLLVFEMSRYI